MKLIKFIAATALVASTSIVSAVSPAPTGFTQEVARVCPNWPHCRDVEVTDQTEDVKQQGNKKDDRKAV
jgi:hypothetical protein